jgi:lysophospholipase L1-like esterase
MIRKQLRFLAKKIPHVIGFTGKTKRESQRFSLKHRHVTGRKVEILCFGDSMTEGYGAPNSYPEELEKLTGQKVRNLGVSGATSDEITIMAGGMKPVLPRKKYRHIRKSVLLEARSIYIRHNILGLEQVNPANRKELYEANMAADEEMDKNSEMSHVAGKVDSDGKTGANEAEVGVDSKARETGWNRITGKHPGHPSGQDPDRKSGYNTSHHAGCQKKKRQLVLILEMGSNGGWNNDYQILIEQYRSIIQHWNVDRYIIVGDTDDPISSIDEMVSSQAKKDRFAGIQPRSRENSWERALREAFGLHFINMRKYLIEYGLDLAGLEVTERDELEQAEGNISVQLRSDWTHFNQHGYYAKAVGIYEKGCELGYW